MYTNSSSAVVHIEGIDKSYARGGARTSVLTALDFFAARGECIFLAGPSGSGKSTLLSILGCILTPDRGLVRIFDQDVSRLDTRQRTILRRDRIGFVFQRFNLIRGLTALDNVCVPLRLRGDRGRDAEQRAMTLLEAVELADNASSKPKNLSAGQCQRIALARALAADPDLILADEPTASLDAHSGREAMTLLRKLTADEGKTAIVVTHDQRIFSFADRICHMQNGKLVEETHSAAVTSEAGLGGLSS